jgi:hypothetical protein
VEVPETVLTALSELIQAAVMAGAGGGPAKADFALRVVLTHNT